MSVRIYVTGRVGIAVSAELVVSERLFRDRQGRRAFAYLVCQQEYLSLRRVLADDLGVDPWPETEALYMELLR